MSRDDWYRNNEWSEDIERRFFEKLKRARRKEQYLRIQASILAKREPDVALSLLAQYFELSDDFDHAQAYCDMASAYIAKGNTETAIHYYRKALERESVFPKLKTDAYILYPLAIIDNQVIEFYQSANDVLDENRERLLFPVDHFRWHAAKAMIFYQSGDDEQAASHASQALNVAQIKKSGFRFHQNMGLVDKKYKAMIDELRSKLS